MRMANALVLVYQLLRMISLIKNGKIVCCQGLQNVTVTQ